MGWVSPTGHNDPDAEWGTEALAYDGDIETWAWCFTAGYYLEFTRTAINCDKVRSYWTHSSTPNVDIDVYYSGSWHNIHSGEIAKAQWVETPIGSTESVDKMRVKLNTSTVHYLREVEFNEVAATELALRSSTDSRASIDLDTAVQLATRAAAATAARLTLSATVALQLRTSTSTRAAIALTISLVTELACRSATATRAAIQIDSVITLALLSQTSTRAALEVETQVRHQEVDVTLHSRQLTTALPGRTLTMAKHGNQQ